MNAPIYAVVSHDGYVIALVNALLWPEIVDQANAIPAPSPSPFPEEGKVWRSVGGEWVLVRDPQVPLPATFFTSTEK